LHLLPIDGWAYKQKTVGSNTSGIELLFKKNKVDWLKGWGRLKSNSEVEVNGETHTAKAIVIATGSEPSSIPNVEINEDTVVSSTGALSLKKIPKTMTVIGAGVIGLELGSVYARLGTEVTVVEYLDHITPGMDAEISKAFKKMLEKQGLTFILDAAVQSVEPMKTKAKTTYAPKDGGDPVTLDSDVVLVSTGRKPFTDGLGFTALGGQKTERGQVQTDDQWRTNLSGVYAIGDVIEGPMLAHKAEDEGMAVAEVIAGRHGHVNYGVIPGVIYTTPEVANVGLTEEQCKAQGIDYKIGKFTFMGNARAKAVHQGDGFVKMIADAKTDRILGCHLIGPAAGDLIHEVCVAMEFGASAQDLALTCHAHPTFSEAMREAALALGDGAIHA
ncbi:MAG: dihydrolipoyl dehydrogenase, partial [Pseudomonadota bacterium]